MPFPRNTKAGSSGSSRSLASPASTRGSTRSSRGTGTSSNPWSTRKSGSARVSSRRSWRPGITAPISTTARRIRPHGGGTLRDHAEVEPRPRGVPDGGDRVLAGKDEGRDLRYAVTKRSGTHALLGSGSNRDVFRPTAVRTSAYFPGRIWIRALERPKTRIPMVDFADVVRKMKGVYLVSG